MAGSSVIGALRVNLGLDSAQFSNGLKHSKQQMAGFQKDMLAIGARIAGALAGAFSLRAMARAADAWSDMSSRVGVAVGDMQAAPEIMERIHKIAQMTYSPLQQTADGFAENNAALKGLGYTTDQALDYTEALNNALVVSGAKGERAASVARALSVALATGKLSGDGLNSVLSNGGEIAELLARQLGTTRNGLIKMASQGKITGDVIVKSLIGNMEELRKKAGDMPATIADGFQKIGNSFTGLVGRMDQAMGISGAFAELLGRVSEGIDAAADFLVANADVIIATLNTLLATGAIVATYFAGQFAVGFVGGAAMALRTAWTQMVALNLALGAGSLGAARMGAAIKLLQAALVTLRGAIMMTGIGALVVGAGYLLYKFTELVRATGGFGKALGVLAEVAAGVWDGMVVAAGAIPAGLGYIWASVKADFMGLINSLIDSWLSFLESMQDGLKSIGLRSLVIDGAISKAGDAWVSSNAKVQAAKEEAEGYASTAKDKISEGMAIAGAAVDKLNVTVEETAETLTDDLGTGLDTTGTKAGGAGAKLSKLQQVMKSLKEEAAKLKATLFMDDLGTSIWEKQTEAGVSAESEAGRQIDAQMRQIDGMKRLKEATEEWRDSIKGAFASFVTGASSFKEMLSQIIGKFAEMLANSAFDKLFSSFGGGGLLGGIMSALGFGGMRAAGGPVKGGTSYIVGEEGPELFTPGQSGMITPNHALGGGGHISIGFDQSTGSLTAAMYDVAGRVVQQAAPKLVGQAVAQTGRAMNRTKSFGRFG